MARKRQNQSPGGSAPWLNTFADLMNLLLCFFVMLFAFSDINAEKFEKVSISMANSIGVTSKSQPGINKEKSISSGMSQIENLDDYYAKISIMKNDSEPGSNDQQTMDEDIGTNTVSGDTTAKEEADLNKALATIDKEMAVVTAKMYDKVSNLSDQYNLSDYVDLNIDPDNKYVELTLKGSVLYDSGEAEIRKASLPIMANIGRILKRFDDSIIEITGYTDNVPVAESNEYKDNNWLSSARALNAAEYLIEECGLNPSKLKYSGRGEYEPIASNATESGRAKNRRIEIKIYNKYSSE